MAKRHKISESIIHVDMDYFYAAIEEREDPSLREKAVVVCMYSGRGESGGRSASRVQHHRGL